MSYGFHAHPQFQVVGAVDAQVGKPSSRRGSLACNDTYAANLGLQPIEADLAKLSGAELRARVGQPDVLISCAPCTGFSRALASNHLVDDPRNSLVARSALFVRALRPKVFLMENARELIRGNFRHHYEELGSKLESLGYSVHGAVHMLDRFGLPQVRERALVIAVERGARLRTLDELWSGHEVAVEATHVRRAIAELPEVAAGDAHESDPMHVSPRLLDPTTRKRMSLIPHDGGSWADLRTIRGGARVLTPAMQRSIARGDLGSFPDVYGRLAWDRPAVTIKRECAHVGNGRYAHPEQDRLCTVREMAILQGFPRDFRFAGRSLSNMYRHIGDAVPPLIAFQLAHVAAWILTGTRPSHREIVLPNTSLRTTDLARSADAA